MPDRKYDIAGRLIPAPGDTWRSNTDGSEVKVLDLANGYVRLQGDRKVTMGLSRFLRAYTPTERLAL